MTAAITRAKAGIRVVSLAAVLEYSAHKQDADDQHGYYADFRGHVTPSFRVP